MSILKRNGTEAIYSQIAKVLKKEILAFLKPGDYIPSEKELAERFDVNRHTIRHAIDHLIIDGLLERKHGKGTFVLDHHQIHYPLNSNTKFTETFENLGKKTSIRILRKVIIPATTGISEHLNIAENSPIFLIETLRLANDQPICLITHYLPCEHFSNLFDVYQDGSLHECIAQFYQFNLKRIESLISAVLPQGDDAALLFMPQNQPILKVKSVNVNERDGTPLEYALTRFRADRIQLRINL